MTAGARLLPMGPRVTSLTTVAAFASGLASGIAVTRRLHEDPNPGRWGNRLGKTRLRWANLPVGGGIALGASLLLPPRLRAPVRGLGLGALAGAVGWGFVDPLPPSEGIAPE